MKRISVLISAIGGLAFALVFVLAPVSAISATVDDQQTLAAANAGFGFRLLRELSREQPESNLFISPYSAETVLQVVCNGATPSIRSEMQAVLGTAGLTPDALNEASGQLQRSIFHSGTHVALNVANAIWYRKGAPVLPEFIATQQKYFDVTIEGLDFADTRRSVDRMNGWVAEKTHGKITSIADGHVSVETRLILVNALYFKAKWAQPFNIADTRGRLFHLSGNSGKQVPMMSARREFSYRKGSGYQAVRMPYAGDEISLYLFLPDPGSSPDTLLDIFTGDKWGRVARPGFKVQQGSVVLPRFKVEYGAELIRSLQALGMKSPFGKQADFPGIAKQPLTISSVMQKTFVDVNEEGTEAAAATVSFINALTLADAPKPFEMVLDRPFLFLIEDSQSGMILFLGVIRNPGGE